MPASAPREVGLGRVPLPLAVLAGLGALFLVAPLLTLTLTTPYDTLLDHLASADVRRALGLTALTSVVATLGCGVLGTPLAWLLARVEFRGRRLLRALVTVPLVLPPVVAGVALLSLLGRRGVLGGPLHEAFGIGVGFTTTAVVLAHVFVCLPFYVLTVEGALRSVGERFDVVAATLGADRWTTFRTVTLPLAAPGMAAGAALAWARSVGEFGATITFAGNYPGITQTMPSLVYTVLQRDPEVARTVSMILLACSVAVLLVLRERLWGRA